VGAACNVAFGGTAELAEGVPRRGVPLILKPPWINPKTGELKRASEPYTAMQMAKIVRKVCADAGLPKSFTLDACRHGGMTELEEAQLTDGQGRALSGHRSKAYERYAKRTFVRALAATRKRRAHVIANTGEEQSGTQFRNGTRKSFRNDDPEEQNGIA